MKAPRSRFVVATGIVIGALQLGCEQFPSAPNEGLLEATIQPLGWPDTMVLATADSFKVVVLDLKGREVVGAAPVWLQSPTSILSRATDAGPSNELRAEGLGRATVTVTFDTRPFLRRTLTDTVDVVVGGVRLVGEATDSASVGARGDTLIVRATGVDGAGADVRSAGLDWSTRGQGIAVIEAFAGGDSVRVIAIAEGEDFVVVSETACRGTCADSIHFKVDPSVTVLTVTTPRDSLLVGDTVQLLAEGRDRNGNVVAGAPVGWVSRDPTVASVDSNGLLMAVDSGSVTIVGSAGENATDSIDVTIRATSLLEIQVTDAPSDYLQEAWIHWSGAYVPDAGIVGGKRYVTDQIGSADLLTLQDGVTTTLGLASVPVGSMDRIFLELDSAVIRLKTGFTFTGGGSMQTLMLPTGQTDSVLVTIPGSVALTHQDTARVVIDFDVNRNFPLDQEPGQDGVVSGISFTASPRAADLARAGSISGTVAVPGGIDVTTLLLQATHAASSATLTTSARSDGSYGFFFVEPGDYEIISLNTPACHVLAPLVINTTVPAGGTASNIDASLNQIAIDSIAITQPQDSLFAIGDSMVLAVSALDDTGTEVQGVSFALTSANPAIATVSAEGTVVARGNGTTQISATSCNVTRTVTVVVEQVAAEVTITDPANGAVSLETGQSSNVTAIVADSNGVALAGTVVAWSTTDVLVATVDGNGRITAEGPGGAYVVATSGSLADSVVVSVLTPGAVVRQVAAASGFSCDVDLGGTAWCWGLNDRGQLGDGTTEEKLTPTPVSGGLPFRSVVAGEKHACGLTPSGEAYCWGSNDQGQLGDGTFSSRSVPTAVTGGNAFRDLDAGYYFTCGLTLSDEVLCWGENNNGQLGTGSPGGGVATPGPVTGGRSWKAVDAGGYQACAIATDDVTYCWGFSATPTSSPEPIAVSGALTFTSVSVGASYACAVADTGRIYCWGQGGSAMGGAQSRSPSTSVPGFQTWTSVFAGYGTTCAVAEGGDTACWGQNGAGQLGNGSTLSSNTPQFMGDGLSMTAFAAGPTHACGRAETGVTRCWGDRGRGALGDGESSFAVLPQPISGATVRKVATGTNHGCAIRTTGNVVCWGPNDLGQLGDGSTTPSLSPVSVQLPGTVADVAVSAYGSHSCAVTDAGAAYCWGLNSWGQLGDSTNTNRLTPSQVRLNGVSWAQMTTGVLHTCGLATTGQAYCWGYNQLGQKGNGTTDYSIGPEPVAGGRTFVSIASSQNATCGLEADGQLFCWGQTRSPSIGNGGVGDGTTETRLTPVEVGAGLGFKSISGAGEGLFCGIVADDTVRCWVDGYLGKIGDGASTYRSTPTAPLGGQAFQEVSAGNTHACGVTTSSAVLCWGGNDFGQLGLGFTSQSSLTPQPGAGGLSLTGLAPGNQMTCGIGAGAQLYCWGNRVGGRTGEGVDARALLPVRTAAR